MYKTKLITVFVFISLCLLLFFSNAIDALERQYLSLEGIVFDSTGEPLNGTLPVTFRIYSNALHGTALWEEVKEITFDKAYEDFLNMITKA